MLIKINLLLCSISGQPLSKVFFHLAVQISYEIQNEAHINIAIYLHIGNNNFRLFNIFLVMKFSHFIMVIFLEISLPSTDSL